MELNDVAMHSVKKKKKTIFLRYFEEKNKVQLHQTSNHYRSTGNEEAKYNSMDGWRKKRMMSVRTDLMSPGKDWIQVASRLQSSSDVANFS